MSTRRGSNTDNEFIIIRDGDRVKRISRRAATAYFRGEPLHDSAHAVFLNTFLRTAEHHPDPRVSRQFEEIRAAVLYADPESEPDDA